MFVTTTRRPLDTMTSLRRLNSALDEAFHGWPLQGDESGALTSAWLPAVDVFEDKEAVKIVAEVPGVRPEDVLISVVESAADNWSFGNGETQFYKPAALSS